jgi:hypothetical protein
MFSARAVAAILCLQLLIFVSRSNAQIADTTQPVAAQNASAARQYDAMQAPAAPDGSAARQDGAAPQAAIRSSCDDLLKTAIRKPYGWASPTGDETDPATERGPILVSLSPPSTATAGLLLYLAGRRLNEPSYIEAGIEAARLLAACQESTGRIPAEAILGATAHRHEAPSIVPDREPTRAALGLLLPILIDAADEPSTLSDARLEQIRRCAIRAAIWLGRQQTANGAFAAAYPPEADPDQQVRIVRLDDGDYRDSTLALYVASEVLSNDVLKRRADASIDQLLAMRIPYEAKIGVGLWLGAYGQNGQPTDVVKDTPPGPDLLASRFAVQTLAGAFLLAGNQEAGHAAESACDALRGLRRDDGTWDRFPAGPRLNSTANATAAPPIFGTSRDAPPPATRQPLAGLAPLIAAVPDMLLVGHDRYLRDRAPAALPATLVSATSSAATEAHASTVERVQLQICLELNGVVDDPFALSEADEVPRWPAAESGEENRPSTARRDLAATLKNLWALLRAR